MIDFRSSAAFSASCRAPAGTPANGWRCGGSGPSYSMKAWVWLLAVVHLAWSVSKAPLRPMKGALGARATSSVEVVRQ